jgi:hypothetical protein
MPKTELPAVCYGKRFKSQCTQQVCSVIEAPEALSSRTSPCLEHAKCRFRQRSGHVISFSAIDTCNAMAYTAYPNVSQARGLNPEPSACGTLSCQSVPPNSYSALWSPANTLTAQNTAIHHSPPPLLPRLANGLPQPILHHAITAVHMMAPPLCKGFPCQTMCCPNQGKGEACHKQTHHMVPTPVRSPLHYSQTSTTRHSTAETARNQ